MAVSFPTSFAAALPSGSLAPSSNSLIPQSTFSSSLNSAIRQTDAANSAIPTTAAETPATVPAPNLPVSEQDTSRTQQLRFQFSGATRGPRAAVAAPTPVSTAAVSATKSPAAEADSAVSGATSPVAPTLPLIPQATVADSGRIAAQVQATALTNPQLADRGLALPTAPPQLGYGAERPPVLAAAETTAAQPVAVENRPGASSDRVATAQIAAEQPRPAPVPAANGFAPILASAAAEDPTAPLSAAPASIVPGADLPRPTRDLDSPATTSVIPQTLPTASPAGPSAVDRPATGAKTDIPSVPEQIAQSVVSQVRVLNKDKTVEYSIRLDPPDLGRVQIRLISTGDTLSAHVTVANDAVRRMMESQLPELRQRLEQAGVNATQIDVSTQAAGQQAGAGDGDSRWQDARQEYPFLRPPDLPPALPRSRVAIGSAGSGSRLDVTA